MTHSAIRATRPTSYIEVPVPILPQQETIAPLFRGRGGHPITRGTAQRDGRAEPATSSLVPYVSITYTAPKTPLEIAKNAFDNLCDLPYDHDFQKYEKLCSEFCEYLDLCEQKGFTIKGYDVKEGKIKNVPLSYENRWSPNRRRELSEKLDRLEYWFDLQKDRPVTMITLTCYHEGMSIGDAWHTLNKSRSKLLKLIAKYFDSPDYFWVPEPHPTSGYVHYHLAVFAPIDNYTRDNSKNIGFVKVKGRESEDIWEILTGKGIEDKFRDIWSKKYKTGNHTYGLDFSQKKGGDKLRSLKKYLSKYLQKGFLMNYWSPALLVFNAHLWSTGFRMYGASTEIRKAMNISDEKDSSVVWLETKINDVKCVEQPDGTKEIYSEDRIVWYRQYIPDWLDSPFWIQSNSDKLRIYDPDPLYIYDWGRKVVDIQKHGYDPTYGKITTVPPKKHETH